MFEQVQLDHAGDLALGLAGLQARSTSARQRSSTSIGVLQVGQLFGVLDDAQVVDEAVDRLEVDAAQALGANVVPRWHTADGSTRNRGGVTPSLLASFGDCPRAAAAAGIGDDLEVGRFLLGLLGRARIGQQQRFCRA